ncbi:flavodoxin family protein [Methanofollis fontis]|nr:flavodoxin family protein [Methanofollis fontis]
MHGAWTVRSTEIEVEGEPGELLLLYEDYTDVCPGLARYSVEFRRGDERLYTYSTNTREYPPGSPQTAEGVAFTLFHRLSRELPEHPDRFLPFPPEPPGRPWPKEEAGALIIQGSPRVHGNTATVAAWAADACSKAGLATRILHPSELRIAPCTACFRCFNSGRCVIDDDMEEAGRAVWGALWVIVCTPVFAGSVPSALKALIDRSLALRARLLLSGTGRSARGIICPVTDGGATDRYSCVEREVRTFFERLQVGYVGTLPVSGGGGGGDLRADPDLGREVEEGIAALFGVLPDKP